MTLKECYTQMGGNYEDTMRRLCNEQFIERFLLKFLNDGTYASLLENMKVKNAPESFTSAHTLKGVALNLGLTSLFEPTDILTELLRDGVWKNEADELLIPVTKAYETIVSTIHTWQDNH